MCHRHRRSKRQNSNSIERSPRAMGLHPTKKELNGKGEKMIEFCTDNNYILTVNALFPHKTIHKVTFVNRIRGGTSCVDYFTHTKTMKYPVNGVLVYRSGELGRSTEHEILIMKLHLKILRPRKESVSSALYEAII